VLSTSNFLANAAVTASNNIINRINTISSSSADTRWTTVNTNDIYLINQAGSVGVRTNALQTALDVRGKIYIKPSTVALPALGAYGGTGDRIILYEGSSTDTPYSIGVNSSTLWYGAPAGTIQSWHNGTTNVMTLDPPNNRFYVYFANGSTSWNYLDVQTTSLWGDGLTTASDQAGTKYITMRAMMFQSPLIVPKTVGGDAYIRMGQAGGIASGTFWDIGVATTGRFNIENASANRLAITTTGNVGINNPNPSIQLSVGSTNANHNMGREIINANNQHNADKRDTFSIGQWDGLSSGSEFCRIRYVVDTGANTGETAGWDNQAYIAFNTWGFNISASREVM
jgi:hypothetical protein